MTHVGYAAVRTMLWRGLGRATDILITGLGQAKLELIRHVYAHDHDVVKKVVGVETVDHLGDGKLVAFARNYFVAKDRTLTQ